MPSKTEIIAQIDGMRKELKRLKKLLGALPEETAVAAAPKRSKAKKDPSAPKRALNAWQSWTVYAKETYPEQMAEFAAADDANKSGLAPKFASYLRECMPEEYAEFVDSFKAATATATATAAPAAVKKPAAAPVATVAVAAASVDSSDTEGDAEGDAGKQWQWKGTSYFRTEANECWSEQGGKMVWAGVYDPIADSMDADAAEPEVEFD